MGYAIGIKVKKAEGEYDLGASKFFGTPTVPKEWLDRFDDATMFLCQIRLSDIIELDSENRLPHNGYLYIFLDTDQYPYKPIVLHYAGEPDTAFDDFNAEVPEFSHFTEDWLISFERVDEDADGIKLLGNPCDWSYGEPVPKVLLQYDPLSTSMGFQDSIDGFIYLLFGEDEADFEQIIYREERG